MTDPAKKNKHLTLEDRIDIQECLQKGMTFKAISRRIGKDPTTISREVKLHAQSHSNGFVKTQESCPQLLKAPYVCNGCSKRHNSGCRYLRRIYNGKTAQTEYETTLVDSREGIPLTKEEFYRTEKLISSSVRKGQNLYHIITSNKLNVSKSTVYRHIALGYYSISKCDLPRAVKFRQRAEKKGEYVPKGVKKERSYDDFLRYLQENPNINPVETDTVIGRIGGKVIMTFQFVNVDFMFGLLLDNKTAAEAGSKIQQLKERLNALHFCFSDSFPVLLADNGGEFSDVEAFEANPDPQPRTRMFFCDPNAPYQKPHVENNHTLFRGIVKTGTSFDDFTQDDVNLIFSHINAVKRKRFNGKSAYDMFSFTYSNELAAALGISYVPAAEVIQSSKLLKYLR